MPNPVLARLGGPRPELALRSSKLPAPSLTYSVFIWSSQFVMNRSSSPSLSKSPASIPMLASALPEPLTAAPDEERAFLEGSVLSVHPQLIRLSVVGDVEVDPAVAVEIGR